MPMPAGRAGQARPSAAFFDKGENQRDNHQDVRRRAGARPGGHDVRRPGAGQGHGRHRHADAILAALDQRRQRARRGAQGEGLRHRPAICRGRHPEPAGADREHGDQGRQGAGRRVDRRHHAVGRAAAGRRQGHQGRRLRPADPRQPERRLLHHLRQLQGRRPAGRVAAQGPRLPGEAGSVQHRAVRRLAGRQQRLLLLRRRHVGAAAADRQGRAGRQVRPDGHGEGRHAALGRRRGAGPHGQHPVRQLLRRQPRRRRAGAL